MTDIYGWSGDSRGSILGGVIPMFVHVSRIAPDKEKYLHAVKDFADLAIRTFLDEGKPAY